MRSEGTEKGESVLRCVTCVCMRVCMAVVRDVHAFLCVETRNKHVCYLRHSLPWVLE